MLDTRSTVLYLTQWNSRGIKFLLIKFHLNGVQKKKESKLSVCSPYIKPLIWRELKDIGLLLLEAVFSLFYYYFFLNLFRGIGWTSNIMLWINWRKQNPTITALWNIQRERKRKERNCQVVSIFETNSHSNANKYRTEHV